MNSRLYEGLVTHRRVRPIEHAFRYRMFMVCLDLGELDQVFRGRWLWSARRPALAWFRRADYHGDPREPLDAQIRDLVETRIHRRPGGRVELLTHLRTFGLSFNPVNFYYCYDESGALDAVVSEITNTPWGERHCYVLDWRQARSDGPAARFSFDKSFHISPFMDMDKRYDWQFTAPAERLSVHMRVSGKTREFDATLAMRRRPITGRQLARVLVRYPLMTARIVGAIYWQALMLWRKGAPFHAHPRYSTQAVLEGHIQ